MIPEYITVSCPHCGAVAGENCQDYAGRPRLRIHLSRITNLWTTIQRNGEPMPIIDNKIAVGKGARWLDVVRPGWYKKSRINLDELDVSEGWLCPLTQAFYGIRTSTSGIFRVADTGKSFSNVCEDILPTILGPDTNVDDFVDGYGFDIRDDEADYPVLTALWKKEVKKRRKENKKKKVPCDAT